MFFTTRRIISMYASIAIGLILLIYAIVQLAKGKKGDSKEPKKRMVIVLVLAIAALVFGCVEFYLYYFVL